MSECTLSVPNFPAKVQSQKYACMKTIWRLGWTDVSFASMMCNCFWEVLFSRTLNSVKGRFCDEGWTPSPFSLQSTKIFLEQTNYCYDDLTPDNLLTRQHIVGRNPKRKLLIGILDAEVLSGFWTKFIVIVHFVHIFQIVHVDLDSWKTILSRGFKKWRLILFFS